MDKRAFLFMITLSLTLFGLNIFFQRYNEQKKQEWVVQQKQKQVQKNLKLEEEIAQRTAPLSNLPLAKVFLDRERTRFLSNGLLIKGQLMALPWSEHLPQKVFVKIEGSQSKDEEFTLVYQQPGEQPLALYQATPNTFIPTITLPQSGRYDLQLLSFRLNESNPVDVQLAEYTDGLFSLPINKLDIGYAEPLLAIALVKTQEGYIPAGFYNFHEQLFTPIQSIQTLAQWIRPVAQDIFGLSPKKEKTEEKFYVLENDYQQLVFSNQGASLSEINLPFRSQENSHSVVREIEVDRKMVEQHPNNALFPSHPYYIANETADHSFAIEKHEKGQLGGYYPLLRRDLIETGNKPTIRIQPRYYALNIVSEYPELAELFYEVKEFTPNSITFEAVQPNRRITKTFSLGHSDKDGPYSLNLEIKVDGDSRGLWVTSGVPEVEWISGAPAPVIKYRITRNQKSEVENIELPKDTTTVTSIYPDWLCNSNGFLGTIIDPLTDVDPGYRVQYVPGTLVPSRLVEIDQEYDRYQAVNLPGYMTLLPLKSQGGKMSFRLFAGPFDGDILKKVDTIYSNPANQYNPDYIACQTMHGWFTFISEPFSKFLLILLKFFHSVTGSWALSIVLLTVCLRIILYPLNSWSTKSMVRMQQIAPEVTAIQEKYKKDPKKAQIEVMNLYREQGVNPLSGCLPLLIQMPFLIGMFDLLKSSFALRGAPFIPGWIDDLTAPDVLFSWSRPIFFIGTEFHLLPILLGLVMFIQQRFFSNSPADPSLMTDQQRQQKAMANMMSIVFAIMFYNFPSGLNIYWLSSMLLGMLQQWYTTKWLKKQPIVIENAPIKPKRTTR